MQKDQGKSPVLTDDADRPSSLAQLTAEIVSAYVTNNKTAPADVAALITAVAGQLSKVGAKREQPREEKSEPAGSVRRSIRPDHLLCLVCGKPQKILKGHLAVKHGLTPAQYRERFELKPDYPMTAPNYAQRRREVPLATGLGRPKRPARRGRKASARSRTVDQADGRQRWRVIRAGLVNALMLERPPPASWQEQRGAIGQARQSSPGWMAGVCTQIGG